MIENISASLLNWASILDWETREQARVTSSMSFIFPHMALMGDAHLGKGATVGSVIPTRGAIMPAAVGVDIGCVDADSEYLSPTGWCRIADYAGGPVMQYEPNDGSARFVEPSAYVVKEADLFYSLRSKYGINQMLTPDHKVLCWRIVGRDRRRVMTTMSAEEFVNLDRSLVQGLKAEFATTFSPILDTKLDLSDTQIRLRVMISADGTLSRNQAVLHLKKERKIVRARQLLTDASLTYCEKIASDGTTYISFYPDSLTKDLNEMWGASAEQLKIIAEECLLWDGSVEDRVFFTRIRSHADFIQYVFTACGYRAVLRSDADSLDGKIDYRVFANTNTMVGRAGSSRDAIVKVPSVDGKAYCFTLPSGFWVMRRGGNVVMTGNCGMMAVRTQFTQSDVKEKGLPKLHAAISSAVPLSAGNYNSQVRATANQRIKSLEATEGIDSAWKVSDNWTKQLGSLGSGNHFIEISLDELDRVWLFLHSGSRGVGNKLATAHIKIAQEQCKAVSLPNADLAYLTEGTQEFSDYIRDLRWAQKFALLNREEMMDRVRECFEDFMNSDVKAQESVNCHHNYTEHIDISTPFGTDGEPLMVWLSRKGAIAAYTDELGLIPGSMGDKSYVVKGLGNPMSLWSAPHGAGRKYSRSKAKSKFTLDDLTERMGSVVWGNSKAFLDEHPLAYKAIDVVMEDAKDLVTPVHELRQILNVKGN